MDIKNTGTIDPRRDTAAPNSGAARSTAPGQSTAQSSSGAGSPPAGNSAADRVTLTGAARSMLELGSSSGDSAPVDKARVAELRQAIADGSYQVRPDRIAAALIRHDNG